MTLSPEILMAYVDGEMSPEEMRRVDEALRQRPDLQAYVAQQRSLARAVHDSFDELLNAPVPESLRAGLARPRSVWNRWSLGYWALRAGLPAGTALACGVLLGVVLIGQGPVSTSGGALVARGGLARALDNQLASQPTELAQTKIGISFRDHDGRFCRTFTTRSSLAGVACHQDGQWRIAAVAQSAHEPGSAAAYAPAGSAMPPAIRDAVSAMITGGPLDAEAERGARSVGWAK